MREDGWYWVRFGQDWRPAYWALDIWWLGGLAYGGGGKPIGGDEIWHEIDERRIVRAA